MQMICFIESIREQNMIKPSSMINASNSKLIITNSSLWNGSTEATLNKNN